MSANEWTEEPAGRDEPHPSTIDPDPNEGWPEETE